jgi:hypothetical protein
MTEEERIKSINARAAVHMQDWLGKLENGENTEDDLLASVYGGIIVVYLLGYSPDDLVNDAKAGGDRLLKLFEETVSVCPNKDENGNCALHNLHCQYPDCEKEKLTNPQE